MKKKAKIALLCLLFVSTVAWGQSETYGSFVERDSLMFAKLDNTETFLNTVNLSSNSNVSGTTGEVSANGLIPGGTQVGSFVIEVGWCLQGSGAVRIRCNQEQQDFALQGGKKNITFAKKITIGYPDQCLGSIGFASEILSVSGGIKIETFCFCRAARPLTGLGANVGKNYKIWSHPVIETITTGLQNTFPETKVFQTLSGFEIQNFSGTAQVFDILGRQLASQKIENSGTISTGITITNGIIFLRLIDGGKYATKKYTITN